ncbi:MAG: PQQ-dependent sugar dehydrogenase [Streptosporangiales bacterium]|nr:PQQ-dependent sugar dehydrogenase [Streptosporangiales bacterium]
MMAPVRLVPIALTTAFALTLLACSPAETSGSAPTPSELPASESASQARPGEPRDVVTGLEVPWAIAFLEDGSALVSERDTARVLRVRNGAARPVGEVPGVVPGGEGGLLGLAVQRGAGANPWVYAYFTAAEDNRIVRMRLDGDRLGEPETILTGIPKGSNHNGGRIAFGPDGMLYAGTGETGDTSLAQDRDSLGGKILRMTPEGEPAPGNPFDTHVWTLGHRNVQGLAWDDKGRMYATEFGQNRYDEINLIEKGDNYGWPDVEGTGGGGDFTDPLITWTTDEASPSGLAYAGGSLWAAALRGSRLWRVPVAEDGSLARPRALLEDLGRLRAVAATPDGSGLWVSTSNQDGRGSPQEGDDRIVELPLGG